MYAKEQAASRRSTLNKFLIGAAIAGLALGSLSHLKQRYKKEASGEISKKTNSK